MNWKSILNEAPEEKPEDELRSEDEKQEESTGEQENVMIPEANSDETTEGQEKAMTPETKPEENTEWQDKVIIPEVSPEESIVEPDQVPVIAPLAGTEFAWFEREDLDELKSRWNTIQIEFVDEPRKSVEQADALVVEVLKRVEQAFTDRRAALNAQWADNEQISTEDLRKTFQAYRSFFNRFLAI